MDKKFENAVDNYSKRIKTITDYVEVVRKMPGMWCGGIGNRGFLSLIREVYQNSIDQVEDPASPANSVYLYYNEITHEVKVMDNGLGFPFDDIERMITTPNTSKNYVKKDFEYSSGLHGVGLKVTNALSSTLIAESYRYDGKAIRFTTKEGKPINGKNPVNIPNKTHIQGSSVYFIPCEEVLGEITLSWKTVYRLIKNILSLTKIGSKVTFEIVDAQGKSYHEDIINDRGIITNLVDKIKRPMCTPIVFHQDTGKMKLDIAFMYDAGDKDGPESSENVIAFCNMCPTEGGDHIEGSIDGICKWFCNYLNKIYLNNQKNTKNKTVVLPVDIKCGLNVMISGALLEPIFVGQAKEILSSKEMGEFCRSVVMNGLEEWSKTAPQELLRLCKYFKDIADARIKSSAEKIKIVKNYEENALTGYPRKFARPLKQNKEFIIVEGDSAAGIVKKGRDVNTQGIFPIRGKIINAFKATRESVFNNEEVQGINKIILNGPYRRDFDPIKDVQWEKIIIMADADVDGAHISALLLRYFLLYMPKIIEAGKLYKSVPPLYSIPKGKGTEYFTRNYDFIKYVQKKLVADNNFCHKNGNTMTNKEATLFFMNNEDYVYYLETIAHTYAVEPKLLELAIYNYYNKTNLSTIQKNLKKIYRFMDVKQIKDTVVYMGTISEANTLFMNDRLIKDCGPVLSIMKKNSDFYYLMNGNPFTIYDCMKLFENSQPSHVQRYKGLGEMNADQIAASTLLPNSDRMLIRYTIDDIKEEVETVRQYESDKSQLLDKVENITRQDLLD